MSIRSFWLLTRSIAGAVALALVIAQAGAGPASAQEAPVQMLWQHPAGGPGMIRPNP